MPKTVVIVVGIGQVDQGSGVFELRRRSGTAAPANRAQRRDRVAIRVKCIGGDAAIAGDEIIKYSS